MAKLTRKTQKIFAGSTTSDQITAFGTAKTTNPVYTTDIDKIQSDIFSQGWTPSLMSDLAPYLQDSNGLWYAITRQLAYIYQQGIAEWDAGTEYTQGSLVSKYNNDNLEIYMSLQNSNTNHQLNESGYWKKYDFNDKMNKDFSNATTQPWNDRLKTDLSNITTTSKQAMTNFTMPDYTAGISLSSGQFTPTTNGYWIGNVTDRRDSSLSLSVGDKTIFSSFYTQYDGSHPWCFPLAKGVTYTIGGSGWDRSAFYPCIGG